MAAGVVLAIGIVAVFSPSRRTPMVDVPDFAISQISGGRAAVMGEFLDRTNLINKPEERLVVCIKTRETFGYDELQRSVFGCDRENLFSSEILAVVRYCDIVFVVNGDRKIFHILRGTEIGRAEIDAFYREAALGDSGRD